MASAPAGTPCAVRARDDVRARPRARAADAGHGGGAAGRGDRARRPACTCSTSARTWSAGCGSPSRASAARACSCASPRCSSPTARCTSTTCASARQLDTYVLRGGGAEVLEPRFTFHGFRYVEVTGLPAEPTSTRSRAASSTPTRRAAAGSSAPTRWSTSSGATSTGASAATSSPSRPTARSATSASAGSPTRRSSCRPRRSTWTSPRSSPSGATTCSTRRSPERRLPRRRAAARRSTARARPPGPTPGSSCPGSMWQRYGDRRLLERHWDAMERYMDHLAAPQPGPPVDGAPRQRLRRLAVGRRAHAARRARDGVLGLRREADGGDGRGARTSRDRAEHYERLRAGIVAAFNRAYVGEDAYIEGDTQTVYLLALHMDLIPEELRARAAERLVENIERHDGHLTTGFVGVGLLCPTLSEAGYSDVAHRLLRNDTFPSWGYSIRHGATTIWERWDGWTEDAGFQTPMMNSFNHYSLGSVGQWLYEHVAGIRAAEPGYGHVCIAPEPGRAGVGSRDVPVRARADHERLAAPGRRAPPRGRDPAQRHRHRRSCPAARPSRWAPAATCSDGLAHRTAQDVRRPTAPSERADRCGAGACWSETRRRAIAEACARPGAVTIGGGRGALRRVADDGPPRPRRAGAPRRGAADARRRGAADRLGPRGPVRAPAQGRHGGEAPARGRRPRRHGPARGRVPRLLHHELLRRAADGRDGDDRPRC